MCKGVQIFRVYMVNAIILSYVLWEDKSGSGYSKIFFVNKMELASAKSSG